LGVTLYQGDVTEKESMRKPMTGEGLRIIAGVTYIGNNCKAKRELSYDPRPLKEGLTETLRYEMKLLEM
jgi:hypothetical protein